MECRARDWYPPGDHDFSTARTRRHRDRPAARPADCYERFGPVFSVRILHGRRCSSWARGQPPCDRVQRGELSLARRRIRGAEPLMGDGLLTIDGDYHRRARRIMLPAFHSEQIAAAADTMVEETQAALEPWQSGEVVDVYAWARELAMRIAMRALLGSTPTTATAGHRRTRVRARAGVLRSEYPLRICGGRVAMTGCTRRGCSTDRLPRDREPPPRPRRREDVLGMLIAATDEDGARCRTGRCATRRRPSSSPATTRLPRRSPSSSRARSQPGRA